MESRQRPPLFENLIKDPPPQGLQAPISNEELEKINRYVERARRLKDALIEFDEALLEQWEDFLQYHKECTLNQNVFAGSHGAPVTGENIDTINALAARLTELSQDHNELRARV
ncbi:g4729 [Coccomyxa viridis]|uniref:G4729 protein n=1 Tax=Coccomyxa viridis TaxID=1274662 RepID=A0ABP1FV02_9CHLO